jgi:predicted RNA-binding Zn-ribbon protein involved in translation (DUF1610 family)
MSEGEAVLKRKLKEAVAALKLAQWNKGAHGYCPACGGWEVIRGRGCAPGVHRFDCPIAKVLEKNE